MRCFLQSPDANGYLDPPVRHMLSHLPLVERWQDADVIVIPISRTDNFRFNEKLRGVTKPWVLVEMSEYFWDWPQDRSFIWGRNAMDFPWFQQNDHWGKLDAWIKEHPPVMMWVRELLQKDVTPTIQPIEFLCYEGPQRPQTKDEFYARPIGVFHNWGRSHEARCWLHGDIFKGSSNFGYDAVGSWEHLDFYEQRGLNFWAAIHTPAEKRRPMHELYHWSRKSKLTTAWPGCGFKTFRHAEACVGSIMATPKNALAWTYPWEHGVNACVIDIGTGVETLERDAVPALYEFLRSDDLHEIYARGLETADKYRPKHILNNHVVPTIQSKL